MKARKLVIIIISISLLLLLASGLTAVNSFIKFITTPLSPNAPQEIFTIQPGHSLKQIANGLQSRHLISSQSLFELYARYKKADKNLQAGEYLLSASSSPEQILNRLTHGRVTVYKWTVVEGLNITEISELISKTDRCSSDKFMSLCHDPDFILELGIQANSLEGYLFPDTYFFSKTTSCRQMIKAMTDNFNEVFTPDWRARAQELGFTVHQIVTLASIIEKETGDASERPLISSVFHNRLKKRMRLESDPTVIYGIKDFDGNITRKHLKTHTPYNTYQIRGLPPGPIANPGAKAIEAALYPKNTAFLFFVSKKDTTHYFSKTLAEHQHAVRKYQLRHRN